MRKEKTISIDGVFVTVKELRTADVIEMFESDAGTQQLLGVAAELPNEIRKLIMRCIDLSEEEFNSITEGVSNYVKIEQAFREVNADFFVFLPQAIEKFTQTIKNLGVSLKSLSSLSGKDT